ncbi:glycosyl transferase family 1 [Kineobactrum sediminis]|uniref:Glycosyl transferase family 1 n=2 Tax=Kineobactrum sediminis TaxID=1905677 RepID=A0A2N5XZM4_9GAMM|nr:glycosyl transferase family 1 [Kineobactrum sediminis]
MAMQTAQLAQLLAGEGVTVELLATNAPVRPAFVARLPGLRAVVRLLPYLLAVWRLAGRVDVVHLMANSGWSWQLYAAPVLWLCRWRCTPVIVNYRGGEAQAYFQQSWRRVKPSMARAAMVVVPSGYLKAVFDDFGQPTRVIPNIIDRELFQPRKQTRVGGTSEQAAPYTLVITRNLEPIYGIDTALKALARVLAVQPQVRLRIAGSGPAEAALRALAQQLDVGHAVTFEGRLQRPAVVALYAEADAMVNPTTVDNMPNSVLEAMACGLPVVSTNVGGVPHILRHENTGLLVPPNDEAALATAILRLVGDEELQQRLRSNSLAEVEQYTWANVGEQWLATYRTAGSAFGGVAA